MLQENTAADWNQTEDDSSSAGEDEMDKSVDHSIDCSTLSDDDETSILLDAEFTFCGERPHAVGRCFLEVWSITLSLVFSSDSSRFTDFV